MGYKREVFAEVQISFLDPTHNKIKILSDLVIVVSIGFNNSFEVTSYGNVPLLFLGHLQFAG